MRQGKPENNKIDPQIKDENGQVLSFFRVLAPGQYPKINPRTDEGVSL